MESGDLEQLWANILSRDTGRIRAAWTGLPVAEQAAVRSHLLRMTTESGWSNPQRVSARIALEAINEPPGSDS